MSADKLLTIRITESLRQEFIDKARAEETSARQIILKWIKQYLGYPVVDEMDSQKGDDRVRHLEERVAQIESELATLKSSQLSSQIPKTSQKDSQLGQTEIFSVREEVTSHSTSQDDRLMTSNDDSQLASQVDGSSKASQDDSQTSSLSVMAESSQLASQEASQNLTDEASNLSSQDDSQWESEEDSPQSSLNDSQAVESEDSQTTTQKDSQKDSHPSQDDLRGGNKEKTNNRAIDGKSQQTKGAIAQSLPYPITYGYLAKAYGISRNTIENWQNHRTQPTGTAKNGRKKSDIWAEIQRDWKLNPKTNTWYKR